MEVSSTGLSRSVTKETNRPTRATVHTYRASSCRDNLQQPVALGRRGLWAPSLFCAIPTLVREYLFTWQLGRFVFGLPAWEL